MTTSTETTRKRSSKVTLFLTALAAGALALGACASPLTPAGDPDLPKTQVEVLTDWTEVPLVAGGYDRSQFHRILEVEGSCVLETLDSYDADVSTTPVECPAR